MTQFHRRLAAPAAALALSLALSACGGGGGGGGGAPEVVSRVSVGPGRAQADGASAEAAISPDGQWVAFSSTARNLTAPGDAGRVRDVFLYSRLTGAAAKASPAVGGGESNGDSGHPSVSSGALFVAFDSAASDLTSDDTNVFSDVFVRNRAAGSTRMVSRDAGGGDTNGPSRRPSISADGRFVAFESTASNVVSPDANPAGSDVFLVDLSLGTPKGELMSRASDDIQGNPGPQPTTGDSTEAAISGSGVVVAYASTATTLVSPSDGGAFRDVFLRDRASRTTERASFRERASVFDPKLEPDGDSFSPSVSFDGALIAFASDATNLVPGDSNGATDVFVYNRVSQTISRVSVSSAGLQAVGGDSAAPSISFDGRYVAFVSAATNLVSADTNGRADVFVHDLLSGATVRASRTAAGGLPNGDAEGPALSSGGQILAWSTEATNVVSGDTNAASDVFTVVNPLAP